MIDPNLDDYWTNQKCTELIWDGEAFAALGLSLAVILKADSFRKCEWFSWPYGQGNILLLCLRNPDCERTPPHDDENSANHYLRDHEKIREFALPKEVEGELGLRVRRGRYVLSNPAPVTYEILVHDNFIVEARPVNDDLVREILTCVLGLHSFYFGHDIDWDAILEQVLSMVKSRHWIKLRTYPSEHRVEVRQMLPKSFWEKVLFRPQRFLAADLTIRNWMALAAEDR